MSHHPALMWHHPSGSRHGHPPYTGARTGGGRGWPAPQPCDACATVTKLVRARELLERENLQHGSGAAVPRTSPQPSAQQDWNSPASRPVQGQRDPESGVRMTSPHQSKRAETVTVLMVIEIKDETMEYKSSSFLVVNLGKIRPLSCTI